MNAKLRDVSPDFRWNRITRPLVEAQRLTSVPVIGLQTKRGLGATPPKTGQERSWLEKRKAEIADVIRRVKDKLKSLRARSLDVRDRTKRRMKAALRKAAEAASQAGTAARRYAADLYGGFKDLAKEAAKMGTKISVTTSMIALVVAYFFLKATK